MAYLKAMSRQIQAVIFDLDGVITDTASFHYRAWKQLTDELGLTFDKQVNEQLKGIDRLNSLEIILHTQKQDLQYSTAQKHQLADRKNEYYKQLIGQMTPADMLPGALSVLQDLQQRRIKTGLASVSKNAFTVVDRLRIRAYFDYIVDAAKITKGKPNPEVFLTAAANLNVAVENCIGVEDAEAGVQAIKSAGMYAVGIGDPNILKQADDILPNLKEFQIEKYIRLFSHLI